MTRIGREGVAGVKAPAFIERSQGLTDDGTPDPGIAVAGVKAPAFIERWNAPRSSPRSGDCGPSVAGVKAPAFIERERRTRRRARDNGRALPLRG